MEIISKYLIKKELVQLGYYVCGTKVGVFTKI